MLDPADFGSQDITCWRSCRLIGADFNHVYEYFNVPHNLTRNQIIYNFELGRARLFHFH